MNIQQDDMIIENYSSNPQQLTSKICEDISLSKLLCSTGGGDDGESGGCCSWSSCWCCWTLKDKSPLPEELDGKERPLPLPGRD